MQCIYSMFSFTCSLVSPLYYWCLGKIVGKLHCPPWQLLLEVDLSLGKRSVRLPMMMGRIGNMTLKKTVL